MTDQCMYCTVRGDIGLCLSTPCYIHSSWFAQQLQELLRKDNEQVWTLVQQLDATNGSPCEQVRHQQEIDQLSERLRKAEEYQDKADSVFR